MKQGITRKCFVIDTSVARCVSNGTFPAAKNCRSYLTNILEICHRIAVSKELMEEWKRHRSRFFRKWYLSMIARKKVLRLDSESADENDIKIMDKIRRCATSAEIAVMEKDYFLVRTAMRADKIIITLDDSAIAAFRKTAGTVRELGNIEWINPATIRGDPI